MNVTVKLSEKAHCRYGDKGDTGLFVVIPYDRQDFDALVAGVTAERVGQHLGQLPAEQVSCRPYPELGALVIVVRGSLRGGGDEFAGARRTWENTVGLPAGDAGALELGSVRLPAKGRR
jgi:hypothetical protein